MVAIRDTAAVGADCLSAAVVSKDMADNREVSDSCSEDKAEDWAICWAVSRVVTAEADWKVWDWAAGTRAAVWETLVAAAVSKDMGTREDWEDWAEGCQDWVD